MNQQTSPSAPKAPRSFHFVIPNSRVLIYQVFAYCIVFINMTGQLVLDYFRNSPNLKTAVGVCVVLLLLLILWDRYLYHKKNRLQSLGFIILILGFRWYQYEMGWGFVINSVLWFLYLIARRRLAVFVNEEGVQYPSFPVRKLPWSALSNLVLKDDVLTIDLKNNKVYQHEVFAGEKEINEQEFNEFCIKNLREAEASFSGAA